MNFILQDILFCSGFQDGSGKSGNSFVHCSSVSSLWEEENWFECIFSLLKNFQVL